MSTRYAILVVPISNGRPELPAVLETAITNGTVVATREGKSFTIKEAPDPGQQQRRELRSMTGRYLGTFNSKAIVVCSCSQTALDWIRSKTNDPDAGTYQFRPLATVWQNQAYRDWLKANGMPWKAGEFGPDPGSTYGRPILPVVYQGQNHDPFAP